MAIIVDKVQKKRDIALASKELFIQKGIHNLTIAEVAKTAGVGKGTIYEYFKNKDEIVFEITNILMQQQEKKLHLEIAKVTSTKDKIKKFSDFFYNEEDYELREIYKEFISITLINQNELMKDFHTDVNEHYYKLFQEIIQNGIEKNELIPESLDLSKGIFATSKGMFLLSSMTNCLGDLKKELDLFIDTIFKLMEVKS